jgi:c-di-GMP-binding flagellar brake protein YcgR
MIERRRYERVPFLCEVTVTTLPGGTPVRARSLDISLGGLGLISPIAIEAGHLVELSFLVKDAARKEVREHVAGRVVNLRADIDGNRIGIEFFEPLSQAKNPVLVGKLLNI